MTATPYQPISWSTGEPITRHKLNGMTANDQYLFENIPTVRFLSFAIDKTQGTKILAGCIRGGPSGDHNATTSARWGAFFTPGCRPIVVCSPSTNVTRARMMLVTKGLEGNDQPDHRGFLVQIVNSEYDERNSKVDCVVYCNYIAVGW